MEKMCVVGSGVMGLDIAYVFVIAGFPTTVQDISQDSLERAKLRLTATLQKLLDKKKITADQQKYVLENLTFTTNLEEAKDCDLIVEAIVESPEIKKKLFADLSSICKPGAIFATNTSSVSISDIASATDRPERVLGMHFFNPAPLMKLVEIIKSGDTSDLVFDEVYEFVKRIGKEPIEVNEAPGFVVNKILITMINEAICVLENGVATAEDIDKAIVLGANHPMGPLALSDLVGNDIVLHIMDTLFKETGDSKYRASVLLRKMVRRKELGRKVGKGFFEYTTKKEK